MFHVFSDAAWADETDTRRLTTGKLGCIGEISVDGSSKQQ